MDLHKGTSCLINIFALKCWKSILRWLCRHISLNYYYILAQNWCMCYQMLVISSGLNVLVNTLRPRQNGRYFADDTFKCIFLNENVRISNKISLKFVRKGPVNNIPALVLIMAWCWPGDKPLSEPLMVRSSKHICVTWPQWVNYVIHCSFE